MHQITFTEAADILLNGGSVIFRAQLIASDKGCEFEIKSFPELCDEYRRLAIDYLNITLHVPNQNYE